MSKTEPSGKIRADRPEHRLERRLQRERLARREAEQISEKATRELYAERHRMEVLLASAGEGIYGMDPEGRTTFVNPAAARMLGRTSDELLGQLLHDVVHVQAGAAGHAADVCALHLPPGELRQRTGEDVFYRSDGSSFPVKFIWTPMRESNTVTGAVLTFNDETERKRFEAQLRYLADHDPLTDLLNRRRFEVELERQVADGRRYGLSGAVLMLDLDGFKYVNDTLGHHAGDGLIRSIAGLLRARLRETDVVARLGGDEFAILLPQADAEQAEIVANDLVKIIQQHTLEAGERKMRVTVSIGIALLDQPELTAWEWLVRADITMYRAKESGRDRWMMFSPEADTAGGPLDAMTWTDRIRRALNEDLFLLYGQTILDLVDRREAQVEVLLRMRGDDGEIIPPGAFLPSAERFGLIQQIDRWVAIAAIRFIAELLAQGRGLETLVHLNLSGHSFADPELPGLIEKELEVGGVPAGKLVFEITETAAIANMDEARKLATRLTEMGCGLALDDFGAGFGTFYYLKYLPITYLKIDGDFITNLPRSETDQHMVKAMVDVAHSLDLKTIAEFVGDSETLELVHDLGVDYAQGFFVSKPEPIAEVRL